MSKSPRRVAVIGAGVTGLSTAYHLRRAGAEVLVLERSPDVGGVITSERCAGFLCERGCSEMLIKSHLVEELLRELDLGEELREANPTARKRFLVRGGRPEPLPLGPLSFLTTPMWSARAKLRLLAEPWIRTPPPAGDERLADFVRRRFGPELLDYGMGPLVSGVFAGDPERLLIRYAFPRMAELEAAHGSIVRGFLAAARERRRAGLPRYRTRIISFRDGMQTLPRRLAEKLGPEAVRTGATLRGIRPGATWQLTWSTAGQPAQVTEHEAVVVTAAPHQWPELPLPEALRDRLAPVTTLPYAPVSILVQGFRREQVSHPLDGFGMLCPGPERRRILGTLFQSTLFPGRAPEGHVCLMTFLGGATQPERAVLPTGDLERLVGQELGELLGVRGDPVFSRHVFWPRAIPQYNEGHTAHLATLTAVESAHPGLHFAGNFRGGVGVGDCLLSGRELARRLQPDLANSQP